MLVNSQATSAPAAVRPPRHSTRAAGRQYAQVNSSSRVQRTETGFPAARARRAASTAASAVCFPPNPPPMSGTITRTRSRGMPSASARICCARKGPSQPAQTVRRSPFHSATAARGSIGACWMKATR